MLVAALALLASAALAAPAFAGEAVVESFGTVIAYRDANDDGGTRSGYDDNDVSITSPSFGKYVVADATDEVVAGAGCIALDAHRAECTDIRITMIYVQLEAGDDRIDVGTGTRTEIWAGSGRDVVNGGSGADEVHGDARCPGGSDECTTYLISAAPLWDTIDGRGGNDLIYGDDSRRASGEPLTTLETLLGGSGNDTIHGGPVSDTLFADKVVRGGPGADTLIGEWGQLDYSDYTAGVNVSTDGNANDGLVGEGDNVQGFWGTILGTPGNDTLSGGQTLDGFGGQDTLTGGADLNFLFGGAGTDLLVGNGGPDFLYDGGGPGDILRGGDGGDTADYSDRTARVSLSSDDGANDGEAGEGDNLEGVEFLTGGAGNDVLTGNAATNRLEGGPGDDLMSDGGGNFDTLKGGPGFDAADYTSRTANISLSDDSSFNDGEPGEQDFVEAESLNAGSGNDTLIGGSGSNDLWGGAGADLLRGGGGSDRLFGGSGNDTADYGWCSCAGVTVDLAADTGTAGGFTDLVVDVEGVNGSPGADTLLGDAGVNLFDGKNGADLFDGRGGGDLYTDTGTDTDSIFGLPPRDTVTYATRSASVIVTLDGAPNDGEVGESDNVGQAIENVIGGPGDDVLTGSVFANDLTGGAGEDTLSGGDGNDTLSGGGDADGLFGGAGTDALEGGAGADDIQGGVGVDTVDYTGHAPAPCSGICPFDPRGPGVEVSLDDVANDGNLGFDSPCCSVPSAPLPAADNVHSDVDVVIGTNGPDTLADVETGADLKGMGGDDRLVDGRGANVFEGGAGTDTVDYSGRDEARRAISIDGAANDGVADSSGVSLENDDVKSDVENVVGGPGPDAIAGSDAANRLTGGPGIDSFDAGEGDDVLNSRDSAAEAEFDCGPGTDTVVADAIDRIEARAACELVQVDAPDTTPPVITANISGTLGANSWYTSDVTVTWSVADGQSAISSSTGCGATTISADTAGTTLTCSATSAGGTASSSVTVKRDATAPTSVATSLDRVPDSNGWYNAPLGWTTTGEDATSGIASCDSGTYSGPDGAAVTASGRCWDNAGNYSAFDPSDPFDYDGTAPSIVGSASPAANANGWNNTPVTVSFACSDGASGVASCEADKTLADEGANQSASGEATDNAGLTSTTTVPGIDIDLTDPSVSLVGGPADGATYDFGAVPAAPTCTASDALAGLDGVCAVSGYSAAAGTHAVTATAKDKAGNEATASRTYTVRPWTLRGFFQPTDMSGVLNIVKNGATVPLKFEVFAGSTELTDTSNVKPLTATQITCEAGATVDAIEVTATGATALRYDVLAGEFVYNWHTPKKPGNCYRVTVTTQDGSSLAALFKLK